MAIKGLKICKEEADDIRQLVNEQIELHGHVDANFAREHLIHGAREDAHFHEVHDRYFCAGGGPAVEKHG